MSSFSNSIQMIHKLIQEHNLKKKKKKIFSELIFFVFLHKQADSKKIFSNLSSEYYKYMPIKIINKEKYKFLEENNNFIFILFHF
jgi:hypothetical protein